MQKPGHGGLTAKGGEQLQRFFFEKIREAEKQSPGVTVAMLQIAAEEVESGFLSREEMRRLTEKTVMAKGVGDSEGGDDTGKVEADFEMEEVVDADKFGSDEW